MLTEAKESTGDTTEFPDSEAHMAFSQEKPSSHASQQTCISPPSPPTAPDGGSRAWLQVLGGFIIYFNTWGLMISFGVFQSYYQNHVLTDYSPSAVSWIGTIQAFFLIEIGVIAGPLYDRGLLRHILATGAILLTLGVMFTIGVCTGIGMGCMFFPGITCISTYFSKKRGIASGIAATGSGVGAIVYPIVLRELIARISFPWAVRTVGFMVLATSLVPLAVMRPLWLPSGGANRHRLFDRTVLPDRVYMFWSLTNVVGWLGLQVPLFYVNVYGEKELGMSQHDAFYLSAILGAGSLPGRIIMALVSDWVGPLWAYPVCMAFAGIVALAWIGVNSLGGLLVVVVLYGFAYGGISSLPPTAIAALTTDMATLGTRIGTSFSFAGIAMLIGPPIGGVIRNSGFKAVFAFSGATVLAGSFLLFGAAFLHRRSL
ncbi:major facilitator superfamily transporter [Diaporthe helianthi]|uniref:Major facilitator superfamily transporter n=1 Tax=Diaporthe helianthi TaxID=158607 RepID=A0A2P5HF21_DIAHE|nr:major facilitator superfamily transporter [Diaporthe helianthi]